MTKSGQVIPNVASPEEWQTEIDKLLVKEKELTRLQDALNAERRRLPMVEIKKEYVFEGENGNASLLDLFESRRQLVVYHFMFAPEWDEGCPGCSWVVDAMSHPAHLHARDTSIVLISRAPLEKLKSYKERMGWILPWYSSHGSDFNFDFGASTDDGEEHGASVFLMVGPVAVAVFEVETEVLYRFARQLVRDPRMDGRRQARVIEAEGLGQGRGIGSVALHELQRYVAQFSGRVGTKQVGAAVDRVDGLPVGTVAGILGGEGLMQRVEAIPHPGEESGIERHLHVVVSITAWNSTRASTVSR